MAERYVDTVRELENVKGKLSDTVIKYLIANSYFPRRCTESAIIESLGMPRRVIHKILADLTNKSILRVEYYNVEKKYVTFTKEEITDLFGTKEIPMRVTDEPTFGTPEVQYDVSDTKTITRYRGPAADRCLEKFIQKFYEHTASDMLSRLNKIFGKERSLELQLLAPEMTAFEKTVTVQSFFGTALFKEMMGIYFKMDTEQIRDLLKNAAEKQLLFVLQRLRMFAQLLEDNQLTHRFRCEYLWTTTLAIREGCIFTEKIGVNPPVLEDLRRLADIVDLALEQNYQGKEREGLSLEEWFYKRKNYPNGNSRYSKMNKRKTFKRTYF